MRVRAVVLSPEWHETAALSFPVHLEQLNIQLCQPIFQLGRFVGWFCYMVFKGLSLDSSAGFFNDPESFGIVILVAEGAEVSRINFA